MPLAQLLWSVLDHHGKCDDVVGRKSTRPGERHVGGLRLHILQWNSKVILAVVINIDVPCAVNQVKCAVEIGLEIVFCLRDVR